MVESSLKSSTTRNYGERFRESGISNDAGGSESAAVCHIRPANSGDLEKVIELDEYITGLKKPEYWRQLLQRFGEHTQEGFFLIASDGERFLGFIIGEVRAWEFGSPPCGWVFAIGVNPECRTEKVGTCLFDEICDRFRKGGIFKVRTMLARADHINMSFFRSQGMRGGPFIQLEKQLESTASDNHSEHLT